MCTCLVERASGEITKQEGRSHLNQTVLGGGCPRVLATGTSTNQRLVLAKALKHGEQVLFVKGLVFDLA
jgi:hypothetical protein